MNGISLFLESQYSKVLIDWTGVYWSFFFSPWIDSQEISHIQVTAMKNKNSLHVLQFQL